jgi:hypothetical protein
MGVVVLAKKVIDIIDIIDMDIVVLSVVVFVVDISMIADEGCGLF